MNDDCVMAHQDPISSEPKVRLALLSFLSLLGAGAGVYLSGRYYALHAGSGGSKSFCNINTVMNCDAVTLSRFAELIPGVPLSSFVAGWFVALFVIGILARTVSARREAIAISTVMTGFASLYSVAMLGVMFLVLRKFCLFCLAIDVINFILFGICWSIVSDASKSRFQGLRASKVGQLALISAVVLGVSVVALRRAGDDSQNSEENLRADIARVLANPSLKIEAPANMPFLGSPDAEITIYEFSDFQCPHCRHAAMILDQLLERHAGKLKIVFMPFPLDPQCNRLLTHGVHLLACELSRSAYCAAKQGKFREVYGKIFEDQDFLDADSAKKIPGEFGVDPSTLKTCMDSEETKKAISASIEEGIRLYVQATPGLFINGRFVSRVLPLEAWDEIITKLK